MPPTNFLARVTLWLVIGTLSSWAFLMIWGLVVARGPLTAATPLAGLGCFAGILIWILPVAGLVTGLFAKGHIARSDTPQNGRGMALAGIAVGVLSLLLFVAIGVMALRYGTR
jgi:hypothetical protein